MAGERAAETAATAAHAAAAAAERAAAAAQAASNTFEHAHTSDTRIAVIGLLGAAVGGTLAATAAPVTEALKARSERRRADIEARGTARVVRYYLDTWESVLEGAIEEQEWWNEGVHPTQEWDKDDLQRVASRLSEDQWASVENALLVARLTLNLFEKSAAGNRPYKEVMLTKTDDEQLDQMYLEAISSGLEALKTGLG